ncbi:hypothetical protein J23TS9_06430 [Paenibacillus sp. J23TS9]|uniref:DUF6906 family protein n=1 Tax=Paenibacillus sp. J23TS9 TaxID=2807193 RepID=UPI001B25D0D0|nr:hypothetical protein [Paenibacillus sp. J23TS9]GIP25513.1 hypothetical protein J23TS9_06430 [Paenibacillus sp. J23TS9]
MKNGKNPSRRQKIAIKEAGFNPDNWLVCKALDDRLELTHRLTGTTKIIYL